MKTDSVLIAIVSSGTYPSWAQRMLGSIPSP